MQYGKHHASTFAIVYFRSAPCDVSRPSSLNGSSYNDVIYRCNLQSNFKKNLKANVWAKNISNQDELHNVPFIPNSNV